MNIEDKLNITYKLIIAFFFTFGAIITSVVGGIFAVGAIWLFINGIFFGLEWKIGAVYVLILAVATFIYVLFLISMQKITTFNSKLFTEGNRVSSYIIQLFSLALISVPLGIWSIATINFFLENTPFLFSFWHGHILAIGFGGALFRGINRQSKFIESDEVIRTSALYAFLIVFVMQNYLDSDYQLLACFSFVFLLLSSLSSFSFLPILNAEKETDIS